MVLAHVVDRQGLGEASHATRFDVHDTAGAQGQHILGGGGVRDRFVKADGRLEGHAAGEALVALAGADRPSEPLLSCHRFRANEVRLQLGVLAYNLGNLWRREEGAHVWSSV